MSRIRWVWLKTCQKFVLMQVHEELGPLWYRWLNGLSNKSLLYKVKHLNYKHFHFHTSRPILIFFLLWIGKCCEIHLTVVHIIKKSKCQYANYRYQTFIFHTATWNIYALGIFQIDLFCKYFLLHVSLGLSCLQNKDFLLS